MTAWTSLLVATPASHSAQQESDSAQKTQDIFGPTSQAEFGFFDPSSASLKTSKDISHSDSEKSLENWNKWVTKCRGEYSLRVKSAHLTSASESSSWPSPIASEVRQGFQDRSRGMKGSQESLTTVVVKDAANWPTASMSMTAGYSERENCESSKKAGHVGNELLRQVIKHGLPAPANPSTLGSRQESWRTPSSSDGEGGVMEMREGCAGKYKLRDHVAAEQKKSWATPRSGKTTDENPETWAKRQEKGDVATMPLTAQVKCWGTPDISDRRSDNCRQICLSNQTQGKLNPRWVETLMGLPIGWTMPSCARPVTIELTNCVCSETELCQQPQSEHSEFF